MAKWLKSSREGSRFGRNFKSIEFRSNDENKLKVNQLAFIKNFPMNEEGTQEENSIVITVNEKAEQEKLYQTLTAQFSKDGVTNEIKCTDDTKIEIRLEQLNWENLNPFFEQSFSLLNFEENEIIEICRHFGFVNEYLIALFKKSQDKPENLIDKIKPLLDLREIISLANECLNNNFSDIATILYSQIPSSDQHYQDSQFALANIFLLKVKADFNMPLNDISKDELEDLKKSMIHALFSEDHYFMSALMSFMLNLPGTEIFPELKTLTEKFNEQRNSFSNLISDPKPDASQEISKFKNVIKQLFRSSQETCSSFVNFLFTIVSSVTTRLQMLEQELQQTKHELLKAQAELQELKARIQSTAVKEQKQPFSSSQITLGIFNNSLAANTGTGISQQNTVRSTSSRRYSF